MNVTNLAGELYEIYCKSVGGKAFNGDPLPDWETFCKDSSKSKQSIAWIKVAQAAKDWLEPKLATMGG